MLSKCFTTELHPQPLSHFQGQKTTWLDPRRKYLSQVLNTVSKGYSMIVFYYYSMYYIIIILLYYVHYRYILMYLYIIKDKRV